MSRPFKGVFERPVKVTRVCPAGVGHERLVHASSEPETLFRLAWQDLHRGPAYGSSTSCDLLARLLLSYTHVPTWDGTGQKSYDFARRGLTERERVVAATVIQWLGTNIGRAFLLEVLEEDARSGKLMVALHDALRRWGHPTRYDRASMDPRLTGKRYRERMLRAIELPR